MLFTKKPEDDFPHDFAAKRDSAPVKPLHQVTPITSPRSSSAPTRSVIDAWLMITGNLHSEGEVQIDGKVDGDIRCAHLTVGKDASISGNITAEEVVVRGRVTGTIRANRVILQESAQVDSEIFHQKLAIEEGAGFEGRSRRCADPLNAEIVSLQAA
jgi:cytoskeletal protein CcmA (bactofilin family)